jgi:hypothetical protein
VGAPKASRGRGQGRKRRGGGAGASRVRPLPRGSSLYTPDASDARRRIERASARPVVFLSQLPRWVVLVVAAGLLVTGLAVKGWIGAAALVLVAAFLSWLAALSWPATDRNGRLLRLAAVAGVLVLAGLQATR